MGEIVRDPVLRQRLRFASERDERGELLAIETWVARGGGVPPHVHPAIEERFEVLAGRPTFLAGRRTRRARPGDEVVVPAGMRHAYWNRGSEEVHFVCRARPPVELERFLTTVAAMSREQMLMRPGIPSSVRGIVYGALLARRYRSTTELSLPPVALQRVLFDPIALLAERGGFGTDALLDTKR